MGCLKVSNEGLGERPCQEFGTADFCLWWAIVPGEWFSVFSLRWLSAANRLVRYRETSVAVHTNCIVWCLLIYLILTNSKMSKTKALVFASSFNYCPCLSFVRLVGSGSCMITWLNPWRGLRLVVALAASWPTAWVWGKLCKWYLSSMSSSATRQPKLSLPLCR